MKDKKSERVKEMEKDFLLNKDGLPVPCKLFTPEDGDIRRVVLGVHGLGGSAMDDIQAAIAEEMEMFYAATLRFDFPGHGENPLEGEAFNLENCKNTLLAAAGFAKERFPEVEDLCIFATGFGAYITFLCMDELLELPGSIKLVVQTPSVLMHETLLSMLDITQPTFQALGSITLRTPRPLYVSYRFYEDMMNNVAMATYPLPFLILSGEQDTYVRSMDIQRLRRINEDAQHVVIPGAGHRFLEEGAWDMVLDLTRDWFEYQQVLVTDWE